MSLTTVRAARAQLDMASNWLDVLPKVRGQQILCATYQLAHNQHIDLKWTRRHSDRIRVNQAATTLSRGGPWLYHA